MKNNKITKKMIYSLLTVTLIVGSFSIYAEVKDSSILDSEIKHENEYNNTQDESNSKLNDETTDNENNETEDMEIKEEISNILEEESEKQRSEIKEVVPNSFVISEIFPDPYLAEIVVMELGKDGTSDYVTQTELDSIQYFYYDGTHDPLLPELKDITGFEYLRNLTDIYIQNSIITNVDALSSFSSFDVLEIKNNPNLENIEGLRGLNRVGHIDISDNENLANTKGLRNLKKVEASMFIENNPKVSHLGMVNLKTIGNDLVITNNSNLETIDGLGSLERIEGSLIIEDNNNITEFTSAQNLQHGGSVIVSIMNNEKLEKISFNSEYLVTLPMVEIKENPNLRTITGMSGLVSLSELTINNTNVNYVDIDVTSHNSNNSILSREIDLRNNAILDLSQYSKIDGKRQVNIIATGQFDTMRVSNQDGEYRIDNPLKDPDGKPVVPLVKGGMYDEKSNTIVFLPGESKQEYGFEWSDSSGNSSLNENYDFSGQIIVTLEDHVSINSKDIVISENDTWNDSLAFIEAAGTQNGTNFEYSDYNTFIEAGGYAETNVPNPLLVGDYTITYFLGNVTSTSNIKVIDSSIVEDEYSISGNDFTIKLDDAKKLNSESIIKNSNTKAYNKTKNIEVKAVAENVNINKVGVYPVKVYVEENTDTYTVINVKVIDEKDNKDEDKGDDNHKKENDKRDKKLPLTGVDSNLRLIAAGILISVLGSIVLIKAKTTEK